jgi:hypothetical protein
VRHGEEARTEELGHLKLALATFALQLDVFEMQARGVLLAARKSDNSILLPDSCRKTGKEDTGGGQ